jgi:tetratricopeptide (TPR) repeat protein
MMQGGWLQAKGWQAGAWLLALALVCGAGCMRKVGSADEREAAHPLVKRAVEQEAAGRSAEAMQTYRDLLALRPNQARAHLGLALLLDEPGGDYLEAYYHYQRYLDLRPDTEKREMLARRMSMAKMALAAGPAATNLAAHARRMEQALADLTTRNSNLMAQATRNQQVAARLQLRLEALESSRQATGVDQQLLQMAPPPAAMQPPIRTVKVEKGDTLMRVSTRVYGDSKRWRELYEANRNVMRTPQDVRVGQVLVVP